MIINNKHVQGIFIYSPDVEYEKGDFVVSGDSIYICTAANPTNQLTFTVMGINPESDSTGNYKVYPGDKISTVQEYYDYVNNNLYWNYKDTKEEVEEALGVGAGGLVILGNLNNRKDLPATKKEGDVYRIGTPSTGYEYAYVPYLEDKYISGSVLNQILQDAFFGVNEKGVITNHVYAETDDNGVLHLDYSIGGTLANIEEGKILNAIMKSPDLNNGMFNVARSLPEISGFIDLDSTIETVLVRQYTYADNSMGNKRIRIQELVDPESSTVYYRWAEGVGVSLSTYDPNRPYHINDVTYYKDKAWISKENNNLGNIPGTDEDWWVEFSGDWSYENITAWTSSFSAGASKVSAQLDSIKAFYTKKVAELEATKKQLTGAFCNREADISNFSSTHSSVTLTAGANVKMHSSWKFIESDEGDLLQELQISSLSDIFTLFKSTSQVDSLLNTSQLNNITVVVKVGSANNFTYSYSKNGNPWQHGNTMASLLQNLGEERLSDIFGVDTDTYVEYPSLPNPDFPFTVILKNRSNGEMKVTIYEPYTGSWDVSGRTLFDQVGLSKKLSTIYYEDLAYNEAILGVADVNEGSALVGNTATIDVYHQTPDPDATDNAVSRLVIPSILPVSNENSSFLLKSSFAEPVCYFSGKGSSIPNFASESTYKQGALVMKGNIPYIALVDITSGAEPGTSNPTDWMEYSSYIELFNRWKSYYLLSDGEEKETHFDALLVPYSKEESIWNSLVLGPSPIIDSIIYPISSIVVDDAAGSGAKKTTKTISKNDPNWSSSLAPVSTEIRKFIPDYSRLFEIEEFRTRISEAGDTPQTIILKIADSSVISYLDQSVGNRKPTGFFCIIYPCFMNEGSLVSYDYEGRTIDPFDNSGENAYYCFIDTRASLIYLRSINDFTKSELEDVVYNFIADIKASTGGIINSIGSYIDTLAVRDSITGNLKITHFEDELSGLNVFFNVNYRGGHQISVGGNPETFVSSITSGGSFSSITKDSLNYSKISTLSSISSSDLGYCVLNTSRICSNTINLVMKVGPDPNKDYNYYVTNSDLRCGPISASSVTISTKIGDITSISSISSVFYIQGNPYNNNVTAVRYGERWKSRASANTTTPYYGSNKWSLEDEGLDFRSGNYVYTTNTGGTTYRYYKIDSKYLGIKRVDISYTTGDIVFDTSSSKFQKFTGSTWANLSNSDVPGVLLLDDTRFDVVLNSLDVSSFPITHVNSNDEFLKVFLALRTKFGYLVRVGNSSTLTMVRDGSYTSTVLPVTPTRSQLLERIELVDDTNVLLETNGFYLPNTLVKDISSVGNYIQEYKLAFNTPSTQKSTDSWVTGAGPLERLLNEISDSSPYPSILYGVSPIAAGTIVNYEVPIRTVCVSSDSTSSINNKKYFVNGNYWVCGSHPANDSDYIKWNDNTNIFGDVPTSMNDLPDAFSLGKIYVIIGQGSNREEWYVVQNPDWLTIRLEDDGSFNDTNRKASIKRWWLSSGREYTCSEEVLFEILHTNFVVNTTDASSQRYKGILWSSSYKYLAGDIVIYHADVYNPTTTYSANSIVSYSGELWKANSGGITGSWNPSRWTNLGVADFSLWKCTSTTPTPTSQSHGIIPASTAGGNYWSVYGDPLFNTLTYIPSKTVLLNNVNSSVPFNLITKIGATSNYSVAVNSRMSDFGTPCIATFLLQQRINTLIYCYTISVDLHENDVSYYVTDSITLTVSGNNDKEREVNVSGGATIKNIYYRYTI